MQTLLNIEQSERDSHGLLTLEEKIEMSVALLREMEPAEGYWLAFSGGKDSCVIKELAKMAGVKFEAWFSNTTLEAPELIRFMREHHPDVQWRRQQKIAMLSMVANAPKTPPTRMARWCCEKYKEGGGEGRRKIIGTRAAESANRAANWRPFVKIEVGGMRGEYLCPIVYWTDDDVWAFLKGRGVPYCALYDEGVKRIGCVGCPLAGSEGQDREFARWPAYEKAWKKAVIANWENRRGVLNHRTGLPVMQARFKTGEDFWRWWRYKEVPDYDNCQGEKLFTN
jgi:phosphoadenosine phosphosulfate reductase